MSQDLVVESVPIKSIAAFEKAIENLKEKGKRIEIRKNSKARSYFGTKETIHDYVIHLPNRPYDVALKRGKVVEGVTEYNLLFDDWGGHVYAELGMPIEGIQHGKGHVAGAFTHDELALSNVNGLMREYCKEVNLEIAAQNGYLVSMIEEDEKNLNLILETY